MLPVAVLTISDCVAKRASELHPTTLSLNGLMAMCEEHILGDKLAALQLTSGVEVDKETTLSLVTVVCGYVDGSASCKLADKWAKSNLCPLDEGMAVLLTEGTEHGATMGNMEVMVVVEDKEARPAEVNRIADDTEVEPAVDDAEDKLMSHSSPPVTEERENWFSC